MLVPFPFTDLPATKLRPAVVLRAGREQHDFILAFASSRDVGRVGPLLTADLDRVLVSALGLNILPYREEGRVEECARLAALHRSGGAPAVISALGLPPLAD